MPHHLKKLFTVLGSALGILLIALGWTIQQPVTQGQQGALTATFFDVGQGDSVLVETPGYQRILIDGGPDRSVISDLGSRLPGGEGIDLMVLTHPHADHAAGLVAVLQRYPVARVLATGMVHTTQTYESFLREIAERKIPMTVARAGQVFDFGENVTLEVLYPFEDLSHREVSQIEGLKDGLNDTSVVVRVVYGVTAMLFTGDISAAIEEKLITVYPSGGLAADILKVPHQGSQTSSSWDFLDAVQPAFAVISVGAGNTYGHPHASVLSRYEEARIPVLRTDEQGTITIQSDGRDVWVARAS